MIRQERADFVREYLDNLYPDVPIPLSHSNNYTLLVAVLLSAQCTDERVNKVTPTLFAKADNPQEMLSMEIDEIYNEIPKRIVPYLASDFFHTPIVKALHGSSSGVRGAALLWD